MSERNKEHGTPHSAKKSAKKKDKSLLEAASSEEDLIHAGGSGGTGTTSVKASMKQKMSSATHIFGKKLAVKTAKLHKPTDKQQLADRASSPTHDTAAGGPRRSSRAGDSGKEKWSYSNDNAEQDWPAVPPAPVFGVPLQTSWENSCAHMSTNSEAAGVHRVPYCVRVCIEFVCEHGLTIEGIYRISPSKQRLDQLRQRVDYGHERALDFQTPHEAAGLLKMFLRQMPEHILTNQLVATFENIAKECPCSRSSVCTCLSGDRIKAALSQLPLVNYHLCAYIMHHFNQVKEQNRMPVENMGIIIHMVLNMSVPLTNILLRNTGTTCTGATRLFEDVELCAPAGAVPDFERMTKEELEQALIDREQVLARLHTTVHAHAGDDDESTTAHEQLWEVQRVVTLIKRHLRQVVASAPVEQPSSAPLAGAADNAVLTTNDTTGVGSSDFVDCEFSASGVVACARSYAAAAGGAAVDTGPCVEIYEEKHLIAVNDEVREKLAMERRSINRLLRQIHQETTRQQQSGVSSIINISATPAVCVGGDDDMSTDWASVYADEVERHERLLADVIEETQHVARLRALIEVESVQQQNKHAAQHQSTASSAHNILVTRL